jgi:hypothetical protein
MAKNLSCPVPTNINPLSPNGFNFSIQKMPEVSFFCQEVNLPGLTLPAIELLNPMGYTPFAGDAISWDDLTIQFLVDENMANYKSLYDWIVGLGFPTDHGQFQDYADSQNNYSGRLMKEYSDGTLQILGSNNQPVQTIRYVDIVITSLGAMTFQSTNTDVNYLIGNATFKYTSFEFVE